MDATKIKRNILDTAGKTLYLYETFQYAVITICVVLVLMPLYVPFYIYLLLIAADVIGFFIYKEISENSIADNIAVKIH